MLDTWATASERAPAHLEIVEDRLTQILKAAERFGVEQIRTFSPSSELILGTEDQDLPNLDRLAQAIEEGWDISTRSRLRADSSDQFELHDSAPDSWLYPLAAKFLMASYLLAANSAMRLFEWEDTGELAQFERSMEAFEESIKSARGEEE